MKFEKDTENFHHAVDLQTIDRKDRIPIYHQDQIAAFKSGSIIKDTLNAVQEGMGEAFHKAVMDEKTKQAKRTR